MGKRSTETYERVPKDLWPTIDPRAIYPIKELVGRYKSFYEPCVGGGDLVDLLSGHIEFVGGSDIDPGHRLFDKIDGTKLTYDDVRHAQILITNPPFTWSVCQPLLDSFISLLDTLVLLPADYLHNKRFAPYVGRASAIYSVGRLKWFRDDDPRLNGRKNTDPTDNFVWVYFERDWVTNPTVFYGRN